MFAKATSDWYLDIDKGKYTKMIFIDLQKEFDTVDHQILLERCNFMEFLDLHIDASFLILIIGSSIVKSMAQPPPLKALILGYNRGHASDPFFLYFTSMTCHLH